MGKYRFVQNERLGIRLPELDREWEDYPLEERAAILVQWEQIRGTIPDRIKELETRIAGKQDRMNEEPDFVKCCELNSEIAELASCINDLHIWFRLNQELTSKRHSE
ncbi:hypothetical protein [Ferviditalea candida]|uniref:Uncharacterized protein n=1 Tax=Ferviditalea candida TaxID=3108399 RepID=A0ABU5ZCM8_9BACL|nr:hypothetical protein [Paenibacillaceae bacterium T2]